jgi:hypothetical protein
MAYRDQDGYLSGAFWLGNVGWSTFSATNWGVPLCQARIVCPTDILTNTGKVCPVHGCAWSQNAGWIVLSGSLIDTSQTGVYYNPSTALIEGFGWSRALGWVPFYAKTDNQELGLDPLTEIGISMDGVAVHFVGKIAVIGNIAGTRIYELPNQNVWYVFSMASQATMMNTIRKNIALISRNITDVVLEDPLSTLNFLVEKNEDYVFDFADVWPVGKRSIVVIGHDIILDTTNSIWDPNDGILRGLIALKDANGNGGNIIISEKVKEIYALVYAEGSIFSWEKTATGLIDQYLSHGAWNIPQKQLYIKGLLISKNTISGARQVPITCPVIVANCDQATAELYDLNYFRTFDPTDASQRAVPYSDPRLDNASMVIEYDTSIMSDSPPWLENTIQ